MCHAGTRGALGWMNKGGARKNNLPITRTRYCLSLGKDNGQRICSTRAPSSACGYAANGAVLNNVIKINELLPRSLPLSSLE